MPPTNPSAVVRLILGLGAVGVMVWVWVTRFDVLRAGHPAYPPLVTGIGVLGLLMLAVATRGTSAGRQSASRLRLLGRIALMLVLALLVVSTAWLRPYPATAEARDVATGTTDVTVTSDATTLTLTPMTAQADASGAGLIFQPGARVDPRAYLPLLARIAEQGHLVVVVKQPLDVGLLAIGAPGAIVERHPEVATWVVGGHSLGGVAAGQYAARSPSRVTGLLLWASYPLDSLSQRTDLAVTSISGTEDTFTTPSDIEASRAKLPSGATVVAVEGGVHSFFGDYGMQPGDGTPTISREVAQDEIVAASLTLLDRAAVSP